jgi:transposase
MNSTPEWFDKKVSKLLTIPENFTFENKTINKHIIIRTHKYKKPKVKLKIVSNNSKPSKIKDYSKSIEKIKEQINSTQDETVLKKLNTSLKCCTTKQERINKNSNKIIKIYSVKVKFSSFQHSILQEWIKQCTIVYNKCIEFSKRENIDKKILYDYTKLKLLVFKELYTEIDTTTPYDMLTDSVREFCSNLKSCVTNLKENNIDKFEIKEKTKKEVESVFVSGKSINTNGIYIRNLTKTKNFKIIYDKILKNINSEKIECDCRLIYDSFFKEYYLKVPFYTNVKVVENREPVVSLDPGEKIFMTYYSLDECGMIGDNIRIPILQHEKKVRKYQRILKQNKNRKQKKLKHKNVIKRKLRKSYIRINNLVKDLHNQTANYLTNKYDNILIPVFETQNMVKTSRIKNQDKQDLTKVKEYKRKSRLNGRVKFVLNMLSHYSFRQHLLHKCNEKGCNMIMVSEEYTSQCCGKCGKCSINYCNKRVKKCENCSLEIDRDVNGSRNILIKNWNIIQGLSTGVTTSL